jgi:hypothetical protein
MEQPFEYLAIMDPERYLSRDEDIEWKHASRTRWSWNSTVTVVILCVIAVAGFAWVAHSNISYASLGRSIPTEGGQSLPKQFLLEAEANVSQ